MNKIYKVVLVVLISLIGVGVGNDVFGATKTWQLTSGSGVWTTPSNWSGGTVPSANDVIAFSLGGTVTVTAVPTFTANQLTISGSTNVTLVPGTAANTLTIAGASGTDLSIPSGCSLTLGSGASYMTMNYTGSSNVATVDGSFTLVSTSITSGQNSKYDATNSVTTINGTFNQNNNAATAAITSTTTTLVINGTYNHSGFSGTGGGTVPTATWNTGSTCIISGLAGTASSVGGLGQTFYNFTWNCTGQGAALGLSGAIVGINGDFTISATGASKDLRLCTSNGSPYSLTVGGNLIINGGQLSLIGSGTSGTNTATITVNGGVQLSNAGILDFNAASNAGTITLIIKGDLSTSNTSVIKKSYSATANINFQKVSGTQTITQSGTSSIANNINLNIGDGTTTTNTVQLSSALNLGSGVGAFTVLNGSTLDCQGYVLTGSNTFTVNSGGGLKTAHASGFSTTASTGSIQSSGTKTYNASTTNFTYNGSGAQATGNALTAATNLTINNTSGLNPAVTLTSACPVSGTLTLTSGIVDIGANDLTVSTSTAGAISGGSSTAFVATSGAGNLIRAIATAGLPITYAFPVGRSSNYTPASFAFSANNTARNLKARAVTSRNTNDGTSTDYIDNRYWITDLSVTSGTYTYTSDFTFLAGDVVGTVGNIKLNRWSGSAWTQPSGSSASGTVLSSGSLTEAAASSLAATAEWAGRVNATTFNYVWNGATDNSWNTATNWTPNGVPTSADDITINGTSTYTNALVISAAKSIVNFTLSSDGTFQVTSTGALTVTGSFTTSGSSVVPTLDCASTITLSSSSSQTIPAWNFGNLNLSGGNRVLASSGSVGICGTFTPGAGTYTLTGSTIDFNGSGSQTIPAIAYNNLTSSSTGARTLASSGTIQIAGAFTPGSNAYTITGSTVDFNGTGAQTIAAFNYNNLTISGARSAATVTLASGTIGCAATFTASATSVTYAGSGNTFDYTSTGTQTITGFNKYNNLSNSGNGARTLANTPTIVIDGTYTPTSGAVTVGTSTIDFSNTGTQTIPATFYGSITNSGAGARTWASSGTIDIKSGFAPGAGTQTITGSTVAYSSTSGSSTLTSFTTNISNRLYNNLIIGTSASSAAFSPGSVGVNIGVAGDLTVSFGTLNVGWSTTASTLSVDGNLLINGGTLNVCTSSSVNNGTLNLKGNLTVSSGLLTRGGTVSTGTATVNFIKSSGVQQISQTGSTITNNLIMNVGDGSTTTNTLQLATGLTYGTGASLNVLSGSSIDFGTNAITTGGTFALNSGATLVTANTAGIVSSGASGSVQSTTRTFSSGANYSYNASAPQVLGVFTTTPTAATINNLTINNSSNLTLSQSITTAGTITLSSGLLDLSTFHLTSNGTISGASSSKYIKTSSTGKLKQTVGTGSVSFPVGLSAYNPIVLDNTGGVSDVYGITVVDALNNAADATYGVAREWIISEAVSGGSNLIPAAQWNSGEEGANYATGTVDKIGLYDLTANSWTQQTGSSSGSNPYTILSGTAFTPSTMSTGTYYFSVGKDYAFIPSVFPPSLTTTTIGAITDVSATIGATITTDNGNAITQYGSVYATTSNPTTNASTLGAYTGTFTYAYTDNRGSLTPQTLYNARGYATNAGGTGYSPSSSFRTLSTSPTLEATGFSAAVISSSQLNLSWSVGSFPSSGATSTGYLILSRTDGTNPTTTGVLNATAPGSLSLPAGTTLVTTISSGATTTYNNTGLTVNTPYNYIIIPFTWDNTNSSTYNYYLTNAPNTAATTLDATLATDYFQSLTSGNLGTPGTWQSSHNGSSGWITSSLAPTSAASTITILNTHNVTVAASVSIDELVVNTTGTLTVAASQTLTIANGTGTDLTVNGTVSNAGTITLSASSTAGFNSGGTYLHARDGAGGNITNSTSVTWNANSNFEVTGWVSSTGVIFSNTVTYGNVRWNSTGQTTTYQMSGNFTTLAGNLRISSTGSATNGIRFNSTTTAMSIGGDFIIDGGILQVSNASTGTYSLTIGGNFNMTAGSFNPNTSTSACSINFTGATKTYTQSGGTLTNTNINWVFNSGASYTLANDISVATSRSLTVNGTLNMGTYLATGAGTFTLSSGGTLGIGAAGGINSTGASGNVQTTTRVFSSGANYVYNGAVNQSTGLFTTTPTALTIATLAIANSGTGATDVVTMSSNLTLTAATNSLLLTDGELNTNAMTLTLPSGGVITATAADFTTTSTGIVALGNTTVSGTVNFYPTVTVAGAVNFGSASTIQNTLILNTGGSVITNAPTYSSASTLIYSRSGTVGTEWSATSGAGYPNNVQISSNSTFDLGAGAANVTKKIAGNLVIDDGCTFTMNGTTPMVASLQVQNLTIGAGASGVFVQSASAGGSLEVAGNFTLNTGGTFTNNAQAILFTGLASQTISGAITFYDVTFNNATGFTLTSNLTIGHLLTLTSGIVTTGTNKIIVTNGSGNAITAGVGNTNYTLSWINGNLRRSFLANTDTYDFPVGLSGTGNLLQMVNNNLANVTYLDCKIAAKAGSDAGMKLSVDGTPAYFVASQGEWQLTPDASATGGSYDLLLYFNGFTGLIDNQFSLIERPDGSTNAVDWAVPAGSAHPALNAAGMTVASGYCMRTGMTTFSKKGIAQHVGILPITLTHFTAAVQNNQSVVTNWETANEKNVAYYEIEHSADGMVYTSIGKIMACGTCSFANAYQFIDEHATAGINYYRLKSVDKTSNFSYSKIAVVTIEATSIPATSVSVYPNPASELITFEYAIPSNLASIELTIYNLQGEQLTQLALPKGSTLTTINTSGFENGIYFYELKNNGIIIKNGKFTIN